MPFKECGTTAVYYGKLL